MDSAHCATDPLRLKPNQNSDEIQKLKSEMLKMKEDYERKIQVLTFENQIKVLEFEKALGEKDNIIQAMKHERDIEKLKMVQKEFETKVMHEKAAENDNTAELTNLERKVDRLENEMAKFEGFGDKQLAAIDDKFAEFKKLFVERENKFTELKTNIDRANEKFVAMKTEILQKVELKLENKADLVALQNKLLKLEEATKEKDDSIVTRFTEFEKRLQAAVGDNKKKLMELEIKLKDKSNEGTSIDELSGIERLETVA